VTANTKVVTEDTVDDRRTLRNMILALFAFSLVAAGLAAIAVLVG